MNNKTIVKIALTIGFFTLHISATNFFGWNAFAQSADEFIIDGIFLLGISILWAR